MGVEGRGRVEDLNGVGTYLYGLPTSNRGTEMMYGSDRDHKVLLMVSITSFQDHPTAIAERPPVLAR